MDLRVDFGHAKCVDDGGDKLSYGGCSRLGDLDEGEEPQLVVGDGELESAEEANLLLVRLPSIGLKTVYGESALARCEPACTESQLQLSRSWIRTYVEG